MNTPRDLRGDALALEILRALATGCTDREVAALVHVSQRTVQRVVDDFKTTTGSRTRLAAGAAAWRLGLLDDDSAAPEPS